MSEGPKKEILKEMEKIMRIQESRAFEILKGS